MKKIAILVPESAVIESVADPQYMFSAANQFLQANGQAPLFEVNLVGEKPIIPFNRGMFSVHTDLLLEDVDETDIIIIPALVWGMTIAEAMIHKDYQCN